MSKSLPPKFIISLGRYIWTTMWKIMMSQMAPSSKSGEYLRPQSQLRNTVSKELGTTYPAEAGRYNLIIGVSCPWAHRTLIVRTLKGLEDAISLTIVAPAPTEGGWKFKQTEEGCNTLAQLYQLCDPNYEGRYTVPVLWDKKTKKIVNNESSEIIVMLNSEFNSFATNPTLDLYPEDLKEQIDSWNEKVYHNVNNGVYRCGFASTQPAYETACETLFTTLDQLDAALAETRYLCGDRLTLADVRLFTTLIRFDIAYYGIFKCSRRRIQDYTHLGAYLRDIYQLPGIAATCSLEEVKQEYYGMLFPLNPGGIIPLTPDLDLLSPHNRENLGKKSEVV